MKSSLRILMKECERGLLSGTLEPTLDWAKEVLEAYKEYNEFVEYEIHKRRCCDYCGSYGLED